VRHLRSDAYSAERVILNKRQIYGGAPVYGHFGPKPLRTQDMCLVPKCLKFLRWSRSVHFRHFGTTADTLALKCMWHFGPRI